MLKLDFMKGGGGVSMKALAHRGDRFVIGKSLALQAYELSLLLLQFTKCTQWSIINVKESLSLKGRQTLPHSGFCFVFSFCLNFHLILPFCFEFRIENMLATQQLQDY